MPADGCGRDEDGWFLFNVPTTNDEQIVSPDEIADMLEERHATRFGQYAGPAKAGRAQSSYESRLMISRKR